MLVVSSVPDASTWYQEVLGLTSAHGGDEYEMLMSNDRLVLQLHRAETDEHPHLWNATDPSRGNGVAIWFETDRFAEVATRAHRASAEVLEDTHINPNAQHLEIWLRDPDGYLVVVSSPFGDTGEDRPA